MTGVPATRSGYEPTASASISVESSRCRIPNAVRDIDEWCKRRQARLVERSNEHIRLGRDLNDPDYRVLLGEHRAYMALRSFIHGQRLASAGVLEKAADRIDVLERKIARLERRNEALTISLCQAHEQLAAQAIEAQRADTPKSESVEDESAVANGDAPKGDA